MCRISYIKDVISFLEVNDDLLENEENQIKSIICDYFKLWHPQLNIIHVNNLFQIDFCRDQLIQRIENRNNYKENAYFFEFKSLISNLEKQYGMDRLTCQPFIVKALNNDLNLNIVKIVNLQGAVESIKKDKYGKYSL